MRGIDIGRSEPTGPINSLSSLFPEYERGSSRVFRTHSPLDRCKFRLAKRIVLVAGQTLFSSAVLDGLGPDVHYLTSRCRSRQYRCHLLMIAAASLLSAIKIKPR